MKIVHTPFVSLPPPPSPPSATHPLLVPGREQVVREEAQLLTDNTRQQLGARVMPRDSASHLTLHRIVRVTRPVIGIKRHLRWPPTKTKWRQKNMKMKETPINLINKMETKAIISKATQTQTNFQRICE